MSKDARGGDDLIEQIEQRRREINEMAEQARRRSDRMMSDLNGGDPVQKQIMLLKLVHLMDNKPDFSGTEMIAADSPQRKWLSAVGALLKRFDSIWMGTRFDTSMGQLAQYRAHAVNAIHGYVSDAIEAIKLELELDGRSEIGTAYAPGDVYRYFADLKGIIASATAELFVIDPYFDGATFDAYFSETPEGIAISLMAEKYATDIPAFAERHTKQFGTRIEIRRSNELHDRLIVVDRDACWVSGGSIKDAGKKATYLIPLTPGIAEAKRKIYGEIWARANPNLGK